MELKKEEDRIRVRNKLKRIRIREAKKQQTQADPNLKHCFKAKLILSLGIIKSFMEAANWGSISAFAPDILGNAVYCTGTGT
jgi:hypothetical protein